MKIHLRLLFCCSWLFLAGINKEKSKRNISVYRQSELGAFTRRIRDVYRYNMKKISLAFIRAACVPVSIFNCFINQTVYIPCSVYPRKTASNAAYRECSFSLMYLTRVPVD